MSASSTEKGDKHMPTNIEVSGLSEYSKRAAASWHMDGARFHVWFNLDTKELDREGLVYKNPLEGTDKNSPGHFNTRKLDGTLPTNAKIIQQVFAEIDRRGLIAIARAAEAKKESERQAENKEFKRQEKIKEAALVLLAEVRAVANGATRTKHCQALLRALGEEE